jgi:hypothetical protein
MLQEAKDKLLIEDSEINRKRIIFLEENYNLRLKKSNEKLEELELEKLDLSMKQND